MRNKTGAPFALAELNKDGFWEVYFDPRPKMDGYWYYTNLTGPIDAEQKDLVLELLLENDQEFKKL